MAIASSPTARYPQQHSNPVRHSSRSTTTGTVARPCGRVRSRRTTRTWNDHGNHAPDQGNSPPTSGYGPCSAQWRFQATNTRTIVKAPHSSQARWRGRRERSAATEPQLCINAGEPAPAAFGAALHERTRRASAVRPRAGKATATQYPPEAAATPPLHHLCPQQVGHGSSRHCPRKRRRHAGPCAAHSRAE